MNIRIIKALYQQTIEYLNRPFSLFDNTKNHFYFVLGAICFCILFLLLFTPYNITQWISSVSPVDTFEIPFVGIFGGGVFMLSHYIQSKHLIGQNIRNYHIIALFFFDSLFLSLCMMPLYDLAASTFFYEFRITVGLVAPILLLWYVIGLSLLKIVAPVIHIQDTNNELIDTFSFNSLLAVRDEQGQTQLTLIPKNLLYIEAADNYVVLHYMQDTEPAKKIIRNSLKKMEELFSPYHCLRCHRSYIVNIFHAREIKKIKSVYLLQLHAVAMDIPISRNAFKTIKAALVQTLPQ